MKITQPEKELEVCDFCKREGYLQECWVCGRQFCLSDEGTVGGSYGFTQVCRECSQREDVHKICEKHASKLAPIFQQRNRALKRLRKATA